MKRMKTTVVAAIVATLLFATTAGGYAAIAHYRAVARNAAQPPATAGDAVATAQSATDGQTASAPPATTPATTGNPGTSQTATPPAVTPPATKSPSTSAKTTTASTRTTTVSRGDVARSPLAGHTIFVDAGHGYPGSGANGPNGGDEAANNLATALILRDMLKSAGAKVVMTRTTNISPTVSGVTDDQLEARTIMANSSGADIFVSLHENYNDSTSAARGLTVYYRSDSPSIQLARDIDAATVGTTGWYNWGTDVGPYYVLNHSTLRAAVLVECGFLSNATDERLLGTTAFRTKIATGVYNGILAYFK